MTETGVREGMPPRCSEHGSVLVRGQGVGRGAAIRTRDLLNPIQVRYQTALRPDRDESSRRPPRRGERRRGEGDRWSAAARLSGQGPLLDSDRVGAWRSLVAHLNGVQEVPRSNRGAPTIVLRLK